ncbi:MAG TPA: TolC family protein, partial [Sedimentisphaerales bacterium]|nr:TolC family protein [Sedimentisphaerales bacterium]
MQKDRLLKKFRQAAMSAVMLLCLLSGCKTPDQHKLDADKEVYDIIDKKWKNDFGEKANYVIKDANNPDPGIKTYDISNLPNPISLAKAVEIATANNRVYQDQKEALYLKALDLTLERHKFAIQWFGTIDSGYTNNADDESLYTDTGIGFNRMLASGAVISTNIALDWTRFLTGDPRTSLGSVLSASITQPLLRGAGEKIAQENLTQAERNVLYEIRSFNLYRKSFVVSVINDYYKVLQQENRVLNEKNNFESVSQAQERLKMEAEAGRRNSFEVDQAEQDKLSARDRYISAQQQLEQILDEFKITLAIPTTTEIVLDPNELDALAAEQVTESDYTINDAIDTSLVNRLDLANKSDAVDDAARKIIVAADNLKAGLDLVAGMSAPSAGKTDFGNIQFQDGTYNMGLEADLPFDRKAERNEYRRALIVLEQYQRDYEMEMDQVKLEVRNSYRKLIELAEKYRIQQLSLKLAEKRVESTSLLLQAGRAQTRDLLDSQSALLNAQNDLTAALVDHAIGKLSFFRDIG